MAPIPPLGPPAAFHLGLKRSRSDLNLGTLVLSSSNGLMSTYGHRLVKEEAEEQLGLSFFCSGHSRWHPHWTKHTYTPGESPAFTHQAASVRRAAERRHRRQHTLLLCLSRGQECPQQEPGPEGLRMFQDNSKCHEEAVFLLSIKKETSPGAEQSSPRNEVQGECPETGSRHITGTSVLCPTEFALCSFLLCLWFPKN